MAPARSYTIGNVLHRIVRCDCRLHFTHDRYEREYNVGYDVIYRGRNLVGTSIFNGLNEHDMIWVLLCLLVNTCVFPNTHDCEINLLAEVTCVVRTKLNR